EALGELIARGLVTADSFNGLRAVLTPQSRRRGFRGRGRHRGSAAFDSAGRWALLKPLPAAADAEQEAIEHAARALLRRYGVVCRALLARETLAPGWRELLRCYRRWEARGEIRGGRFIAPLGGEQFALIDAVEELRRVRRASAGIGEEWLAVSAADPASLAALAGSGTTRVPAVTAHRIAFRNGAAVAARVAGRIE